MDAHLSHLSNKPDAHAAQLRGIWLRLGGELVLRGLDLDIRSGEHITLLGSNGAGKTTLLRLLASAIRPTRGQGRIFGYDLNDSQAVREQIHFMPVHAALYPDLSCFENLEFALKMHQIHAEAPISKVQIREQIHSMLEQVQLEKAAHRRARHLSAGMRKRLALARAALLARPLTLIDEPFANLDGEGRALALALLEELKAAGCTLVIAAHEPELARQVAPRALKLAAGQLRELQEQP